MYTPVYGGKDIYLSAQLPNIYFFNHRDIPLMMLFGHITCDASGNVVEPLAWIPLRIVFKLRRLRFEPILVTASGRERDI